MLLVTPQAAPVSGSARVKPVLLREISVKWLLEFGQSLHVTEDKRFSSMRMTVSRHIGKIDEGVSTGQVCCYMI